LSNFVWILIFAQLLACLLMTGNKVLFDSGLSLWFNENYFGFEKLNMILSGYYEVSQELIKRLPENSSILMVTNDQYWFINYYLLPRKMYKYMDIKNPEDIKRIPAKWIKEKRIDHILLFYPPNVRILKVGKDVTFE